MSFSFGTNWRFNTAVNFALLAAATMCWTCVNTVSAASPAAALAVTQDDDKHKEHKIHVHRHGDDENVEVIVVQENEKTGDVAKLHQHLIELAHSKKSGDVDLHGLANKLRQIADQLDGKGKGQHSPSDHVKEHNIELHHSGAHKIHVEKLADGKNGHRAVIAIEADTGKKVDLNRSVADAKQMIVQLKTDGDRIVRKIDVDKVENVLQAGKHHIVLDTKDLHGKLNKGIADIIVQRMHGSDDHPKVIKLHADHKDADHNVIIGKLHADHKDADHNIIIRKLEGDHKDPRHNIVVEKLHGNHEAKAEVKELMFGSAKTSDENASSEIDELRKELAELRKEIEKLRSKK